MSELIIESKREIKRKENLKKLIDAMNVILEKYDYNTVTIRNICTVSKVSYGSFYNLFKTKEAFLTYYLTNDFIIFEEDYYKKHKEFEQLSLIDKSIDVFKCCAYYNVERGLDFISAFYSPKNYSLSPIQEKDEFFCFTPLVKEATKYLSLAKKEGQIKENENINEIVKNYCFIFNGLTFNWCISQGKINHVDGVDKQLHAYINQFVEND